MLKIASSITAIDNSQQRLTEATNLIESLFGALHAPAICNLLHGNPNAIIFPLHAGQVNLKPHQKALKGPEIMLHITLLRADSSIIRQYEFALSGVMNIRRLFIEYTNELRHLSNAPPTRLVQIPLGNGRVEFVLPEQGERHVRLICQDSSGCDIATAIASFEEAAALFGHFHQQIASVSGATALEAGQGICANTNVDDITSAYHSMAMLRLLQMLFMEYGLKKS